MALRHRVPQEDHDDEEGSSSSSSLEATTVLSGQSQAAQDSNLGQTKPFEMELQPASSEPFHTSTADRDDYEDSNGNAAAASASATSYHETRTHELLKTIAGIAGNVLEWYDFAVFGFLSDGTCTLLTSTNNNIEHDKTQAALCFATPQPLFFKTIVIGSVFFPPQAGNAAIVESFAVFGGAFLMRPIGGVLMGYIGDTWGRKKALEISIFLMAVPTFLMGCLPSYQQVGWVAIVLLCTVRLLQGLSVGGQLMSSLVFTLENHPKRHWGLYGSYVMASANFGTLLGGIAGFLLRSTLNDRQLHTWGWRLPFLSGILVAFSGIYLKYFCTDQDDHGFHPHPENEPTNPIQKAFARENLRSLLASSLVPMLWSAGFYLSFVWMAIYMQDLIDPSVPHSFLVNSTSLLVSVCLLFPLAGIASDKFGRRRIMTIGGTGMGVLSPIMVMIIGNSDNSYAAMAAQSTMGIALSLWGAPMCAWLVESFDPASRLTSVAIGYNLAHAIVGGLTPSLATIMVDSFGINTPGFILTGLAASSLVGLLLVAPPGPVEHRNEDFDAVAIDDEGPNGGEIDLTGREII
jgi:MHS family proline/betaine transporter-like MFS transporter